MPSAAKVAVTDAATALHAGSSLPQDIMLKVATASSTVYLGGSDVDDTDGFPLATADGVRILRVLPGDVLYAITASGSVDVSVLAT